MAIKYLAGSTIEGLSTDTKPTTVPAGYQFIETDTGKIFLKNDAGSWILATEVSEITDQGNAIALG